MKCQNNRDSGMKGNNHICLTIIMLHLLLQKRLTPPPRSPHPRNLQVRGLGPKSKICSHMFVQPIKCFLRYGMSRPSSTNDHGEDAFVVLHGLLQKELYASTPAHPYSNWSEKIGKVEAANQRK